MSRPPPATDRAIQSKCMCVAHLAHGRGLTLFLQALLPEGVALLIRTTTTCEGPAQKVRAANTPIIIEHVDQGIRKAFDAAVCENPRALSDDPFAASRADDGQPIGRWIAMLRRLVEDESDLQFFTSGRWAGDATFITAGIGSPFTLDCG